MDLQTSVKHCSVLMFWKGNNYVLESCTFMGHLLGQIASRWINIFILYFIISYFVIHFKMSEYCFCIKTILTKVFFSFSSHRPTATHICYSIYSISLFSISYFSICVIWQKVSKHKFLCRVCIALLLWGSRVFYFFLKFIHLAPACPPALWFCLPRYSWHLTMFTCLALPSNLPPGTPHTQSQDVVSGVPRFSKVFMWTKTFTCRHP